tara:strand:+ start:330 stop:617 length:288 start_codon:yes stop_codon:yes gene_type:complete
VKRNNFTKNDISFILKKKLGYSNTLSKKLIDDLILTISENIINKQITLKNVGSFKILQKKERIGRNPKTNDVFIIKKRNSISFTVSKNLLKKLNN